MTQVFLASRNAKKLVEMRRILVEYVADVEVLGLDDVTPYDEPAVTMSVATCPCAPAATVMFRKPGPAMSTAAMPAWATSSSASSWASARGLPRLDDAPSCSATLVA